MRVLVLGAAVGAVGANSVPTDRYGAPYFTQPECNSPGAAGDDAVPGWIASKANCEALGSCKRTSDSVFVKPEGSEGFPTKEEACGDGEQWEQYSAVDGNGDSTIGFLDENVDDALYKNGVSTPRGWTGATRFPRDADGASCWALEGEPKQPTYKLPMCKMYNENACCAPIHDAETQWAYETLVNVADR